MKKQYTPAVLAIGGNLGDRLANIRAAVEALEETKGIKVRAVSPLVESFAVTAAGVGGDQGLALAVMDEIAIGAAAMGTQAAQQLHRLQQVRFPTAVRPHNTGQTIRDDQIGGVNKAFEACQPEFRKAHVLPEW